MTKILALAAVAVLLAGCSSAVEAPEPEAAPIVHRPVLTCGDLLSLDQVRAASGDEGSLALPEPAGPAADLVCLWGSSVAPSVTVTVDRAAGVDFEDYRFDDAAEWTPPAAAEEGSYACTEEVCEAYLLIGRMLVNVVLVPTTTAARDAATAQFPSIIDSITAAVAEGGQS